MCVRAVHYRTACPDVEALVRQWHAWIANGRDALHAAVAAAGAAHSEQMQRWGSARSYHARTEDQVIIIFVAYD